MKKRFFSYFVILMIVLITVFAMPVIYDAVKPRLIESDNNTLFEVGFSPNENAGNLVLKTIAIANTDIYLASYTINSQEIVSELISAKSRGINVSVVVDSKQVSNTSNMRTSIDLLSNAGIAVKTVSNFNLHDKFIVIDRQHVQTGSFNYTNAAIRSNSENVLVVWNNPQLAGIYLKHWSQLWDSGILYQSQSLN